MATENNKDTRELILEAAFKVFGNYGFDGTSMKAIAREAGIVPGSIYNYFSDKEELFTSAVKTGWDRFTSESQKIGQSQISITEKFGFIIDLGFNLIKKAQPLLKGMFLGANQRSLVQENLDCLLDSWEKIISEEQKQQPVQTPLTKEERRTLTKYVVMGVLLAVAIVPQENMDEELEKIKNEIRILVTDKEGAAGEEQT